MRFTKHYTVEEARLILPLVRKWLKELAELRREHEALTGRIMPMRKDGEDLGGDIINSWARALLNSQLLLLEFHRREIQVKDLERGLIDFPSIRNGKEIFLCWEEGEEDVEFWHDLESGYAGRERL